MKITDKRDLTNVKRNMSFKSRIEQMKINKLLVTRKKPKTKESESVVAPIVSFSSPKKATTIVERMDDVVDTVNIKDIVNPSDADSKSRLAFTQQKMKEIAEKRRKRNERREQKRIRKLLESKKMEERQREIDITSSKEG